MQTELLFPLFILLSILSLLLWGFFRARHLGEVGILSWLQFLTLIAPWLLYFGLSFVGIVPSFALLLSLLLISAGGYILLGNRLRIASFRQLQKKEVKQEESGEISPPTEAPSVSGIKQDMKILQGIFGVETFYATESQLYREGILFRGNLRSDPQLAYQQLSLNLQQRLPDRYELFLVAGQDKRPMVIILPRQSIDSPSIWQKLLSIGLVLASFFTSVVLAGQFFNLDIFGQPSTIPQVLPFGLGAVALLGIREYAQRSVARREGVILTLPYALPSLQVGAFGVFSRILSPLSNRRVLFDLAAAPAIVGILLSVGCLMAGLWLSIGIEQGIEVPAQIFQASVLTGTLAKVILGKALESTFITLHPLVLLGWLGMVITGLNLLPAGQLEGGRMIQAIYGRRVAGWATFITLLFLGIASIINPLALYWGGIIFVLLRDQERPMLNELSELDNERDALGLCLLFWMLVTLLPMTSSVAAYLGIGSIP